MFPDLSWLRRALEVKREEELLLLGHHQFTDPLPLGRILSKVQTNMVHPPKRTIGAMSHLMNSDATLRPRWHLRISRA